MARKVRLTFGSATSRKFVKRTYSFFSIIANFPEIGMLEDSDKGIYGFVLEKPVTIFYRLTKKEVIILNFFDSRMSPDKRDI